MNGPGSRPHPRNEAMAALAVANGVPREAVAACLEEATRRGLSFADIAVQMGVLTAEQGRYLFSQTAQGLPVQGQPIAPAQPASPHLSAASGHYDSIGADAATFRSHSSWVPPQGPSNNNLAASGIQPVPTGFAPAPYAQASVAHSGVYSSSSLGSHDPSSGPDAATFRSGVLPARPYSPPTGQIGLGQSSGAMPIPMPNPARSGSYAAAPGVPQSFADATLRPGAPAFLSPTPGPGQSCDSDSFDGRTIRTNTGSFLRPTNLSAPAPALIAPPVQGFSNDAETYEMAVRRDASGGFLPAQLGQAPAMPYGQAPSTSHGGSSGAASSLSYVDLVSANVGDLFAGDHYEVVKELGQNRQIVKDRRINRELIRSIGEASMPPQLRASFLRLPRILAQLDHPAIPPVHDLVWEPRPYYTLDRSKAHSLDKRSGPAEKILSSIPSILRLFLTVAAAIRHAHERGVLHTGLEARVVQVGEQGQVLVTGWQRAVALPGSSDSVLEAASAAPPTGEADPEAVAPELRLGEELDERCDVWGLGALLYELLCGRSIAQGDIEKSLEEARFQSRTLPRELTAILRKALNFRVGERYQTAAALELDVRRYVDGERVEAAKENPLQTLIRLSRKDKAQASVLIGAFLLLVGGVGTAILRIRGTRGEALQARQLAADFEVESKAQLQKAAKISQSARAPRHIAIGRLNMERLLLAASRLGSHLEKGDEELSSIEQSFHSATELAKQLDRASVGREGFAVDAKRRVRMLQADWLLRRSPAPDPKAAIEQYISIREDDPQDLDATIGQIRAMRRLQRYDREVDELILRTTRSNTSDPRVELIELLKIVNEGEALLGEMRRELDTEKAKKIYEKARTRIDQNVLDRFAALKVKLPSNALLRELYGRAFAVRAGIGHPSSPRKLASYGDFAASFSTYYQAYFLDPTVPDTVLLLAEQYNEKYGHHQSWRWVNAWIFTRLFNSERYLTRPEPLKRTIELLLKLGHETGAHHLAELMFKKAIKVATKFKTGTSNSKRRSSSEPKPRSPSARRYRIGLLTSPSIEIFRVRKPSSSATKCSSMAKNLKPTQAWIRASHFSRSPPQNRNCAA
jgi:hypothetical protein